MTAVSAVAGWVPVSASAPSTPPSIPPSPPGSGTSRAELAGRAGQQQPAPRHGRVGHLKRGGQQPGLAEHAQPAGRQHGRTPAGPEPVAGQPGQAGSR